MNLNNEQQEAVKYNSGPLLIVAGAGTGKTATITHKIVYLIENNLAKTNEILAVTFTEKATLEMNERVTALLTGNTYDLTISTFHGFCQTILENHVLDIGLPNNFKLFNDAEAWLLIRKNLHLFNLDYYRPLGNPAKFIHALIKHFNRCKDELITPEEYLNYAQEIKLNQDDITEASTLDIAKQIEIVEAYHVYNQLLLQNNVFTFADLIYHAVNLFKKRPNILEYYRQKFKYILVDEFQDTNWSQYELIKMLCLNSGACLTVVGDDDQSIYKFRGASVSNIMQFKEDFKNSKEIVLTQNYRSTQNILDCAHNFIRLNDPDRLEAKLQIDKKLQSSTANTGAIELLLGNAAFDEAQLIADKILEIKNQTGAAYKDFAVLCRANSYAEPIISACQKHNIHCEFIAFEGLFKQKIVLNAIALLKLLDNYHESPAVFRVLSSPFVNLEYEDLSKILFAEKKQTESLYNILKQVDNGTMKVSEGGALKIRRLLQLVNELSMLVKQEPVNKILYLALEKSGYLKMLSDTAQTSYQDILYLQELFKYLENFAQTNVDRSVREWLEYYRYILDSGAETERREANMETDKVKIMTVHAAKGLEFAHVFITNLVEQRFPTNHKKDIIDIPAPLIREKVLPGGDEHLQEERRLMYVAITRAKQSVFFTAAKNYGGVKEKRLSKFIAEIETTNNLRFNQQPSDTGAEIIKNGIFTEMEEKWEYIAPVEFSFSQLQAYETCPYQYRFQFALKLPAPGKGTFSFGKTMHATLQKIYQRIMELNSAKQNNLFAAAAPAGTNQTISAPTLQQCEDFYKQNWIDEWYENASIKQSYYQKGLEIIRAYHAQAEKNGWTVPLSIETGFKFNLEGNIIKGQIDRIEPLSENKLLIIDYKTGRLKDKLNFDDKQQLLLYQLAAQSAPELSRLGAVGELEFYYLDNNTAQIFLGTEAELQKIKTRVLEIINQIKNRNFNPTPSQQTCHFCDFKDICNYCF